MQPAARRSLRILSLAFGALGLAMCVDGPTGPHSVASHRASFAFAPQFESSAHGAVLALADEGLPLDRVRVVIVRPANDTLKDTTVTMHQGDAPISLELAVDALPNEDLLAGMQFKSGETVLFSGIIAVKTRPITASGPGTPVEIPLIYVGPGAAATKVVVTPASGAYPTSGTIQFTASATDDNGTPFLQTPFEWSTNDATLGSISTDGLFTPSGKAGSLAVTATTPKGVKGTATALLAPQPASIVVVSGDNQSAPVTQQVSQPLVVQVRAADGTGVPGQTVNFAATDGGSVNPASAVTGATGQAQTTLKVGTQIGAYHFTATAGAFAVGATANGTVGAAAKLGVVTQPQAAATSSIPWSPQPTVRILDVSGNPVPQSGVVITVALTVGSGILNGTTTATTDATGLASFTNLSITGSPGSRTITFSAPSLTAATATTSITVGVAAHLAIVAGNNQSAVAGAAVATPPRVSVTDAGGNPVNGAPVLFTVTGGGGSVTASVSTDAAGEAATPWTLGSTAGANSLSAAVNGATGVTPSSVTFNATGLPGAATKLSLATLPSDPVQSGVVFAQQPTIQLRDANNNAVALAGVVVTVDGGTGLAGTTTATTNASGVAAFTNLLYSGVPGSRTLVFSAPSLTSVSRTIVLIVGPPKTLTIVNAQQTTTVGTAVASPQGIRVADDAGNPLPSVTVHFHVDAASGTPADQDVLTNASGIATPASWTLGAVGDNTMAASIAATGVTNNPATIHATGTAPVPPHLELANFANTMRDRIPLTTALSVQVTNSNGQPVAISGKVVTLTMTNESGTGTLLGSPLTATTNASGIASFSGVTIAGTVGNKLFTFSSTEYGTKASGLVMLGGLPATMSAVTGNNQTAYAGLAVDVQPRVKVVDIDGNGVQEVPIRFTISAGSGSVPVTVVGTNFNGEAPIPWTLGTIPGLNVLTATAMDTATTGIGFTGFTGTPSLKAATFTGNPVNFSATGTVGPAALMMKLPGDTLSCNGCFQYPYPTVKITDAFGNPVAGVSITFSVDSSAGLVIGEMVDPQTNEPSSAPLTYVTDQDGTAYVYWYLSGSAGFNQLIATINPNIPTLDKNSVTFRVHGIVTTQPARLQPR